MKPNLAHPRWLTNRPGLRAAFRFIRPLCLSWLGIFCSTTCSAETTVNTLGGGPLEKGKPAYGYADGTTLQQAQFNNPFGCALDTTGRYLYVADRDNNKIRILDLPNDRTRTLLSGLSRPVSVAVDATNNLYVVAQGSGHNGAILFADVYGDVSVILSNLVYPSGIALDAKMHLYFTELGNASASIPGTVKCLTVESHTVQVIRDDLIQPVGLALTGSGLLAVTEAGNHTVKLIQPDNGAVLMQWGTPKQSGFHDGPPDRALFNQPQHIATAPNGNLVVADRSNHRVRVVNANGIVTTLYGIDPREWGNSSTNWPDYPGWLDGDSTVAESHDPVGIAIGSDGSVYGTEDFYHIIRFATASDATAPPSGDGGTNVLAALPVLEPDTGYLPMGQMIKITDPNTNIFVSSSIYYSTDGTEPTTNSAPLGLTNHVGYLRWTESLRDLTSLRVKVFLGNNNTALVSGRPPNLNFIGVHRDLVASSGSALIVPIVLNLKTNQPIQSLQFRLQVEPKTAETPPLDNDIQALDLTTNSFVVLAGSKKAGTVYHTAPYIVGKARGIAVTFLGSFANFEVEEFGAAGIFAVPIPASAVEGNTYNVKVLEYSATSDAGQATVVLTNMPVHTITVKNPSYQVGDAAPGVWYNAGDFGNNQEDGLDNADANAVFYASLGYRLPYLTSDVFDAMDAFPEDSPPVAGGDGQIRFLDWQTVFYRSMRLPGFTKNYLRYVTAGGERVSSEIGGQPPNSAPPRLARASAAAETSDTWFRPVQLASRTLSHAPLNTWVNLPINVIVQPGCQVGGMQLEAIVEPLDGAPHLDRPIEFVNSTRVPPPALRISLDRESLAIAWNLGDFKPALQGSNTLGFIRFVVPGNASSGNRYRLRFAGADGAPDFSTQYDFETIPSSVWVLSDALQADAAVSVEWVTNYFGRLDNPWAQPNADPDQDGVSNQTEYARGTSPVKLRLHTPAVREDVVGRVIRWFGQKGKQYVLEATDDLDGGSWHSVAGALTGANDVIEVPDTAAGLETRFYRVQATGSSAVSGLQLQSQSSAKNAVK
jgi:hypothetical protein